MKKYLSIPLIIGTSLLLSGFSFFKGKTPSCNDNEAKEVLAELIQEEIENSTQFSNSFWQKNSKQLQPKASNIVTNEHNKKLDIYWCGADITIQADEKLLEQYLTQQKRDLIVKYDEQFKQSRKSIQEKLSILEEKEREIPHIYNEALSSAKNKIIDQMNKLEQNISKEQIDYQARKERSYRDFEQRKQSYLNAHGGKLDENAKLSLKYDKEAVDNALQDRFNTYIQPKIQELDNLKNQSEQLPELFKQAQEKEQQGIQNQKNHLINEETRLREKLEQDKQRIADQLDKQRADIQQGLDFPVEYKIQSFEDSDEFYVEIL